MAVVFGGIVIAAASSSGRTLSHAHVHDGGAWLPNHDLGLVGHMNRVVEEISETVGPFQGAQFDVAQHRDIVIVHDKALSEVRFVDPVRAVLSDPILVPSNATVAVGPNLLVVHDSEGGRLWRFSPATGIQSFEDLEQAKPTFRGDPASSVEVGRDGTMLWLQPGSGDLTWVLPDGTITSTEVPDVGDDISATLVGQIAVIAGAEHTTIVEPRSEAEPTTLDVRGITELQTPSEAANEFIAVIDDQLLVKIGLADGAVTTLRDLGDGTTPHRPVVAEDCAWVLTVAPTVTLFPCTGEKETVTADPERVSIRYINGFVWLVDASNGGVWMVRPDQRLRPADDWTTAAANRSTEVDEDNLQLVTDPESDSVLTDRVEVLAAVNNRPVANDDQLAAAQGTVVTVRALRNDFDQDLDPLVISELRGVGDDGSTPGAVDVSLSPDKQTIQVVPADGFAGTIRFGYVVDDGRGGADDAEVTISVVDGSNSNADPEPARDTLVLRAGNLSSVDVLANDHDPDGDALTLVDVEHRDGVSWSPGGTVLLATEETDGPDAFVLTYSVADTRGGLAAGELLVEVTPADENRAPLAVNDVIVTTVGRPALLNVLTNDMDVEGEPLRAVDLIDPSGSDRGARLDPLGDFVFRPDEPGTYLFLYSASDGEESAQAIVRVEASAPGENQPPVPLADTVTVTTGVPRLARVLANDLDPDGDVVAIVAWSPVEGFDINEDPAHGFRITASPDAPSTAQLQYWVSDGQAPPVPTVVNIVVANASVALAPVARDDRVELRPGRASAIAVLANDFDPDGDRLVVLEPLPEPPGATLRVGEGGQFIVSSIATDASDFSFGYQVSDRDGNRASAEVRVRVIGPSEPNRAPVTRADRVATLTGHPVAIDVAANDVDPDGDAVRVEAILTQPSNGRAVVGADGLIEYTPAVDFTGTDRFTYGVIDSHVGGDGPARAIGEVAVGVVQRGVENEPVNTPPTAVDDPDEATAQIGGAAVDLGVLRNDLDPDGDHLTIVNHTTPNQGVVEISPGGGLLTYTPPLSGDPGQVTFSYAIADGNGGTDDAVVTLELLPPEADPIAPIALDDEFGPFSAGESVQLDVLANDYDPDGATSALVILDPSDGAFTVVNGLIEIIVPDQSTQIPYQIIDPDGQVSSPALVSITVTPNATPTVLPVSATVMFETRALIDIGVAVSDPDGDDLTFLLEGGDPRGTIEIIEQTTNVFMVAFTPDAGFFGLTSFGFAVTDSVGNRATGSVTVEVGPPEISNSPPVAADREIEVEAGQTAPIDLATFVDDADLAAGDALTFVVDPPELSHATLSLAGSRLVVSTDPSATARTDRFRYVVTDNAGASDSGVVTLRILASTFPPPVAANYTGGSAVTVNAGGTTTIQVLDDLSHGIPADLRRSDGQVVSVDNVVGGQASITNAGTTVSFTPTDGAETGSFSYTVHDERGREGSTTGRVEIIVRTVPDPPTSLAVSVVDDSTLRVTWSPPLSDGGLPVTAYTVRYSSDEQQLQTDAASDLAVVLTDLTPGERYTVDVAATNGVGTSRFSAAVVGELPEPLVPPQPPQALQVVAGGVGRLVAGWSPPAAHSDGSPSEVDTYEVSIDGGSWEPLATGASEYEMVGYADGVSVEICVRARNAAGAGDSACVVGQTLTVPGPPTELTMTPGPLSATVSWGAPAGTVDRYDTTAVQQACTADNALAESTEATSRTVTVMPGSSFSPYYVCVRAVNAVGAGPWGRILVQHLPVSLEVSYVDPCGGDPGCRLVGLRVQLQNVPPGQYSMSCFDGTRFGGARSFQAVATDSNVAVGEGCIGEEVAVVQTFIDDLRLTGTVVHPTPPTPQVVRDGQSYSFSGFPRSTTITAEWWYLSCGLLPAGDPCYDGDGGPAGTCCTISLETDWIGRAAHTGTPSPGCSACWSTGVAVDGVFFRFASG